MTAEERGDVDEESKGDMVIRRRREMGNHGWAVNTDKAELGSMGREHGLGEPGTVAAQRRPEKRRWFTNEGAEADLVSSSHGYNASVMNCNR